MNIKKILFLTITTVSLLFTGIITNNVSANSNKNNSTLTSYPKYMRGTWWINKDDKITITKHTIVSPEGGGNEGYLHKLSDAKNHTKNTSHWAYATYNKDESGQKWLENNPWNAMIGMFYNVSKIDGRQVLSESGTDSHYIDCHAYKNRNIANKLDGKKYHEFNYIN